MKMVKAMKNFFWKIFGKTFQPGSSSKEEEPLHELHHLHRLQSIYAFGMRELLALAH
jgi:hypothetical protein